MLKRVTAECMEDMPALGTRRSHVPGSSARERKKKVNMERSRSSIGEQRGEGRVVERE